MRQVGDCRIVKNIYGEYVVKAWDREGKRYEQADYYAYDMVDARATMYAMQNAVCDIEQYLKNERR
jgi:hypothetical protein